MVNIALYPDQAELVERTRAAMRQHKAVLLQLATGGGKTVLAAHMVHRSMAKGTRSMFLVPRRELLRQTSETFLRYDIAHGIQAAGYNPNPFMPVQIATTGTLARRLDHAPKADVVFVDEAHFGASEQASIIAHYRQRGAWIVGLSATPTKLSGKGLDDTYDHMECGPPIGDLIAMGRLSGYRMFAPSHPDLSGIATVAGDYAKGQLASRMESDRVLTGDAVKHYADHALGRLCIAYCTSVLHAQIVADAFRTAGIAAASIDGGMGDDQRARIIKAFARRELLVLTNCELLTFGFDLASAAGMDVTVEALADLRPTKSVALQLQKWGRALRKKAYSALIFDHAGNVEHHGMPDDDRDWTLAGMERKEKAPGDAASAVRQCPACYFCHRPAPVCPNCGSVYPVQSRMVEQIDGDLHEITESRKKRQDQGRAQTVADLIKLGHARGMKNPQGWAHHVIKARMAKR